MFNNAGIPGNLDFTILNSDNENFKCVFDVNVFGSFLGAKHAARVMIPAKRGVILFSSSVASVLAGESPHSYTVVDDILCASTVLKGVVPMADDVAEAAVYLGSDASKFVTGVNLVVDGGYSTTNPTYSRVIKQTFEDLAKKKECCNGNDIIEELVCESAVLKRAVPTTDDVAEAAVYLASDDGKFVSGLNLVVDGGYSATNQSFIRVVNSLFT
uniref:Secoisolariciresinol dehydrogenase-like n=1 Tax=Tanacetum cinerariifolium TaxID=118510 RepID=A0A699HUR4_TANCI|nr:hypothetical protein [Tanacetum cinerariifolium]